MIGKIKNFVNLTKISKTNIVTQEIKKGLIISLEVLRSEKAEENKQVLPFVSAYNPNNPNLFLSTTYFHQVTTTKDIFRKYKVIDYQ